MIRLEMISCVQVEIASCFLLLFLVLVLDPACFKKKERKGGQRKPPPDSQSDTAPSRLTREWGDRTGLVYLSTAGPAPPTARPPRFGHTQLAARFETDTNVTSALRARPQSPSPAAPKPSPPSAPAAQAAPPPHSEAAERKKKKRRRGQRPNPLTNPLLSACARCAPR